MGWSPLTESSKAAPRRQLRVAIAGLGVSVETRDQGLAQAVQGRYQGYLTQGPVHLQLALSHHPDEQVPHILEPKAVFFDGGVRFQEPAFEGEIDVISGRAQVRLNTPDPLPGLEYFLRVIFALLAFEVGGLLFHGAGILKQGAVYLFFGPSGTGKTTVSRSVAAHRVLNDDLVLLFPEQTGWTVYATPFWNPSQVVSAGPQQGPLAGLYRLVQSSDSFVEPMGRGQAVAELVANTPVIAADPDQGLALLTRAQALAQAVPPKRLHLLLGDEIWPFILRG